MVTSISREDYSKTSIEHDLQNINLLSENKKILIDLVNEKRAIGQSDKTIRNYTQTLRFWNNFFKKPFNIKNSSLIKKELINYFSSLKKENKNGEGTILIRKLCIKQFYKWLRGTKDYPAEVEWIETSGKKGNGKLPKDMPNLSDIKKMLDYAVSSRNKALIMMLYDSAGRISEILDCKVKDLVFDEYGGYIVVNGKTGSRQIRLVDSIPFLKEYLNNEYPIKDDKNNPDRDSYLFVGLDKRNVGKPLTWLAGYSIIKRIAVRSGIKKNIHPHIFRHAKLTELAKSGFRDAELRVFAGWAGSSKMPSVYLHISDVDVGNKILENAGVKKRTEAEREQDNILKPKVCIDPTCKFENPAGAKFCKKCHRPLDIREIEKLKMMTNLKDKYAHGYIQRETKDRELNFEDYLRKVIREEMLNNK